MAKYLDLLRAFLNDFMKTISNDNELYDITDGQFMYFEKNRTRNRPLSNKEIRAKQKIYPIHI